MRPPGGARPKGSPQEGQREEEGALVLTTESLDRGEAGKMRRDGRGRGVSGEVGAASIWAKFNDENV